MLGSLNMDISVTVPRLPEPGATVLGSAARFTPGGKGANQAVAAARLGAEVRMAGCVGGDDFGRRLLAALRDEGVGHDGVRVTADAPTGLAMISVDHAGENIITVAPGANHEVGPAEVRAGLAEPQTVLVVCAEIPVGVIVAALARHRASILNLAPAPEPPADAAAIVAGARPDWLVVNETEAGAVLGRAARRGHRGRARRRPRGPRRNQHYQRLPGRRGGHRRGGGHLRRRARRHPGRGHPGGRSRPRGRGRGRHRRHQARRPGRYAAPGGHPRHHRSELARRIAIR